MLTFVIVICGLLGLFAYLRVKSAPMMMLSEKIPGPRLLPLIGNALDVGTNTTEFFCAMERLCKEFGDTVRIWMGPKLFVIVSHPDDMEIILGSTKILEKAEDYEFLRPWLGNGLLTSFVSKWRKHRKILTPTFHFKILEQFIDVFNANSEILIEKLSQEVDKPTFDIYRYITLAALDNISETAMGVSVNAQKNSESEYVKAVRENIIVLGNYPNPSDRNDVFVRVNATRSFYSSVSEVILTRGFSLWLRPNFLFKLSPQGRLHDRSLEILHGTTKEVIRQRKSEFLLQRAKSAANNNVDVDDVGVKKRLAFLDLLIEASLNEDNQLTDEDIREEVDTFMFEGHDTTSSAISFTLWLLSQHPDIQDGVVSEVTSLCPDAATPMTYHALQTMKYTERVIKEALRLYPSVPFFGREAEQDITLHDGLVVPTGTTLSIYPYRTHHDPKIFPDPERFDPDRFLPEHVQGRHPYAYLPFSAGSRNCIGQKFAMLEMKCTVAHIVQSYQLLPGDNADLKLASELILKSKTGIRLKLKSRTL